MSTLEAIVLGFVQGLTEFLPISSSGHLRIVPALLGWEDPGAGFTAVIQLGTMAAVLIYFRADLWRIASAWLRELRTPIRQRLQDARLGWFIILGTIPICVFGFIFKDQIESGARSLYLIGSALILFSFVMLAAEHYGTRRRDLDEMSGRDGLFDRHRPGPGADPRRLALGGDDLRRPLPRLRPRRRRPLLVPALGPGGGPQRPLRAAQDRRSGRAARSGRRWSRPSSPSSPATSSIAWLLRYLDHPLAPRSSSSTGSRSGSLVLVLTASGAIS